MTETQTQPEPITLSTPETPQNPTTERFVGIVQRRLETIINPPTEKPPEGENKSTPEQRMAQALSQILQGKEITPGTEITLTIKKTAEEKPAEEKAQTTEQEAQGTPNAQPQEEARPTAQDAQATQPQEGKAQPQESNQEKLITEDYKVVRTEEGKVVLRGPSGEEVQYPVTEIAKVMAEKIGLPPHQIAFIEQYLSGQLQEMKPDQLEEWAKKFGYFTKSDLYTLLGIPSTSEERKEFFENSEISAPFKNFVKKIAPIIDNLPDIPEAGDVTNLFKQLGIKPDQSISNLIKTLPEEQRNAWQQLLGEDLINTTIEDLVTQHYQKIDNGEDIKPEERQRELIERVLTIAANQRVISEAKKKHILDRAANLGKTGTGIALLLSLIFILKAGQELKGGQPQ